MEIFITIAMYIDAIKSIVQYDVDNWIKNSTGKARGKKRIFINKSKYDDFDIKELLEEIN